MRPIVQGKIEGVKYNAIRLSLTCRDEFRIALRCQLGSYLVDWPENITAFTCVRGSEAILIGRYHKISL